MRLYNFIIKKHVKAALEEDIGFYDISSALLADSDKKITVFLNSRADGVLCGCEVFKTVFKVLCADIKVEFYFSDSDKISNGDTVAKIEGSAEFILTAERTALNYIQRMSAIATETAKYKAAIGSFPVKIADTRKTTPGFRLFEKYAVKTGGGSLHRFNLSDCVMLKDNHIALAGSIKTAVERVKNGISHAHKIEVECDNLEQVKEAVDAGADIILLDNMSVSKMKEAVTIVDKKAIVEASGNITLENIKSVAMTGVDIISSSSITTGAKAFDLGLDF